MNAHGHTVGPCLYCQELNARLMTVETAFERRAREQREHQYHREEE